MAFRGDTEGGGGDQWEQVGDYTRTRQIKKFLCMGEKMATGGNSKRVHTPDPEEEEEDEFVGPIPMQQKPKKRRGILMKYHFFLSSH